MWLDTLKSQMCIYKSMFIPTRRIYDPTKMSIEAELEISGHVNAVRLELNIKHTYSSIRYELDQSLEF